MKVNQTQVSMKSNKNAIVNSTVLERLIKEVKQNSMASGRYDRVHNRHNR